MRHTGLKTFATALALACGLTLLTVSSAAEVTKAKERISKREITGDFVAKTSRTLSIETSRSGGNIEETLIPVNPSTVKLERIKSLSELQRGDKVRVQCELTYREDEQGEERLTGMTATKITWFSRGAAQTGGLRSETGSAAQ